MRTYARGSLRAFVSLSNEFERTPTLLYVHRIIFNLTQLNLISSMNVLKRHVQLLRDRKGLLNEIVHSLLRCLPTTSSAHIQDETFSSTSQITEWNVFESSVFAMVSVLLETVGELRMRTFERICNNMRLWPVHLNRIAGAPNNATDLLRLARYFIMRVRYLRRAKRMEAHAYLAMQMQTKLATSACDLCIVCMRVVHKRHVVLDCGHTFHKTCMLAWICQSNKSTCPVCRQHLPLLLT